MRLLLLFALLLFSAAADARAARGAANPQFVQSGMAIIGRGSTTFAYLDPLNKPCGVGMRSSGSYPVFLGNPSTTTPTIEPMGDSPDADPNSTTICTTAQWAARWGCATSACNQLGDNAALVSYLNDDFGFANTGEIYYLATTGSDSTGAVNDPSHPYATMAKILGVYQTQTTSHVTCTGNVTSGSAILTITGGCSGSPGLQRTDNVTGTHLGTATYIQAQLTGTAGGVGTYLLTVTVGGSGTGETITGSSLKGGVIAARAGTYTTCAIDMNGGAACSGTANPNFQLSGSYGHPLLVMAFPGEVVEDNYLNAGAVAIGTTNTRTPGRASCCLILDGIEFLTPEAWGGGAGDGFAFAGFEDLTIQHTEWAGYVQNFIDPNSKNIKINNNVFHELNTHAIYITFSGTSYTPNFSSGQCSVPGPGDFNFATDYANYLAGLSCGSISQLTICGNDIYNGGPGGYDLLHLNTWINQATICGNIISFTGGSAIDLQSGNYNDNITGNLAFDIGGACFELYLDASIPPNGPSTHRWNTIANNVCYLTDPNATSIWGSEPQNAAVWQVSSQVYPPITVVNTSNILTVTSNGTNYIAPGMLINYCTGVPTLTYLLAIGADGTTGPGVPPNSGTYAMSANATQTVSSPENCEFDNAAAILVSDTVVKNNVIVTTDNGATMGQPSADFINSVPFDWQYNSSPASDTITVNTFWSGGSTSNRMAYVSHNADPTSTIATCSYNFSTDGSCATNFNAMFPGNTYAGANPFVNMGSGSAMSALYQTPGAYDFAPYNLR